MAECLHSQVRLTLEGQTVFTKYGQTLKKSNLNAIVSVCAVLGHIRGAVSGGVN